MKSQFIIIFINLFILNTSCKRKKTGCMDTSAINFDLKAELSDGSCKYNPPPPLFLNPSFDTGWNWSSAGYSGTCPAVTPVNDGFMPTDGPYFLKCVPTINCQLGTKFYQYVNANKYYKGFYFDYSYCAVAGADSVLKANVHITFPTSTIIWTKIISETAVSFGGLPNITVQKRNEYVELPLTTYDGDEFAIYTTVTKGTFTFQMDNIREIPR